MVIFSLEKFPSSVSPCHPTNSCFGTLRVGAGKEIGMEVGKMGQRLLKPERNTCQTVPMGGKVYSFQKSYRLSFITSGAISKV